MDVFTWITAHAKRNGSTEPWRKFYCLLRGKDRAWSIVLICIDLALCVFTTWYQGVDVQRWVEFSVQLN